MECTQTLLKICHVYLVHVEVTAKSKQDLLKQQIHGTDTNDYFNCLYNSPKLFVYLFFKSKVSKIYKKIQANSKKSAFYR